MAELPPRYPSSPLANEGSEKDRKQDEKRERKKERRNGIATLPPMPPLSPKP